MSLPNAELARVSLAHRVRRWIYDRLAPPRTLTVSYGFGAASYWSLTGALAAGFTLGLYLLCMSGNLWGADFTLTIGWAIFAAFGVVFWFWPFLGSYYMYAPLRYFSLLRTRMGAAIYGGLWHTTAHCLLIYWLEDNPFTGAMLVPMAVGGLWGSWLPTAFASARSTTP